MTPEASGLAASSTRSGVYFVVDDGRGVSSIAAVDSSGAAVATIEVAGMAAKNGEALAAGPCGDRPGRCLYIGDIGDNSAKRGAIVIYRIAEPSFSPPPVGAVPAAQWQYRYPQGPQDAESLLVTESGSVLVITKSAPGAGGVVPPHRIYRGEPGGGVMELVGQFTPPNPASRRQSLFTGTVVTDVTYANGRLLLLTYDEVIEYLAPKPGAHVEAFPSWRHHSLPAPEQIQSEGIALDPTGCGYAVASEEGPGGSRATLAAVTCR